MKQRLIQQLAHDTSWHSKCCWERRGSAMLMIEVVMKLSKSSRTYSTTRQGHHKTVCVIINWYALHCVFPQEAAGWGYLISCSECHVPKPEVFQAFTPAFRWTATHVFETLLARIFRKALEAIDEKLVWDSKKVLFLHRTSHGRQLWLHRNVITFGLQKLPDGYEWYSARYFGEGINW